MIAAEILPAQTLEQFQARRWARLSPEQIQQHIRFQLLQARIPPLYRACSFQTLDPSQDPEAFRICREYAEEGEYQGKKGLLLMGTPGNGKTSLAVAILRRRVEQTQGRYSVRFWNVPIGLSQVRQTIRDDEPEGETILELTYNRLLVLDDVGKQQRTPWVKEQLYTLLENMGGKQLILTTNQTPAQLKRTLDPALVSRLRAMCHPVVFKGMDRRGRKRRGHDG